MGSNGPCVKVDNLRDLERVLQENDRVIAMVYTSWCPFCRRVLPVFEMQVSEEVRHLLLVTDDEEHVADLYGIDVFPTLILFEKGMVAKRLDGKPGIGLTDKQITDFVQSSFSV